MAEKITFAVNQLTVDAINRPTRFGATSQVTLEAALHELRVFCFGPKAETELEVTDTPLSMILHRKLYWLVREAERKHSFWTRYVRDGRTFYFPRTVARTLRRTFYNRAFHALAPGGDVRREIQAAIDKEFPGGITELKEHHACDQSDPRTSVERSEASPLVAELSLKLAKDPRVPASLCANVPSLVAAVCDTFVHGEGNQRELAKRFSTSPSTICRFLEVFRSVLAILVTQNEAFEGAAIRAGVLKQIQKVAAA